MALFLIASTASAAGAQENHATAPRQPGPVSGSETLLPNGWSLSPAGAQVATGGFPLHVIAIPHTHLVVMMSNGYGEHFLSLIDSATARVVQRVPIHEGWMGLAVNAAGSRLYASSGAGDSILIFDLTNRQLKEEGAIALPAGTFPAGIVLGEGDRLLYVAGNLANKLLIVDTAQRKVVAEGPTGKKPYTCVVDSLHGHVYVSNWGENTLSVLDASSAKPVATVKVQEKPGDMVISPDRMRVFVTDGDRNLVSMVNTETQQAEEEIDVSLNRTPLAGSTPDGVALSANGRTLFVACANNNSVAVVDVTRRRHAAVPGFLPVGWFPSSLTVLGTGSEQRLVVANAKGAHSFENGSKFVLNSSDHINKGYVGLVLQGTVSVIPFRELKHLPVYTQQVLRNSPFTTPQASAAAPFALGRRGPIQHVIYIIKENRTYDQVLGDMKEGNGEASYAIFGEQVTPNQHAMARQFTLFDNLYHNAEVSATGHFWTDSAIAPEYVEKLWPSTYSGRGGHRMEYHDDDDDYPASGFLWDQCAKKGISYRSYGEFARVLGAAPGKVRPFTPSLQGHINPDYRGSDVIATVSDTERYGIWHREFMQFVEERSLPAFEVISLPGDHTVGTRPGAQTPRAMVAENDLMLAKMLDDISHSIYWKSTAVFVIEDDAQNGPDHIDCHRTTAFVLSPYIRRHFVDHTMYSSASVVRTMELLLGLPPMTQYDASAVPMWASFQAAPDMTPFSAVPARIPIEEKNTLQSYGAAESMRMPLDAADQADDGELNEILWKSVRGAGSEPPSRRLNAALTLQQMRQQSGQKHATTPSRQ
ncbi:bifunctional YncE family protein/alkaline phosphatase family protein [Paracidobacterium acidisoli]|uniref:bifunctional YncE family protein/alkaline phosphatase family protein n=1 Tax=Paracidobacterium acidisoli TaxID=2303751 RepID=UPI001314DB50|nr:bifunctional YncE family protein/alkaline phosphatase family protein [Paracidobacterium acidisoli]